MSEVIQKVEGKFIKNVMEWIECDFCGSIWTIRHEVDGEVLENNPQFISLKDKQCECKKGVCQYRSNEWESYQKGYIVVQCDCGEVVECHNFTNTCSCGADYNFNGERLADRSQWGSETGEDWWDCY